MGLLGTMTVRFGADTSGLTRGISQARSILSSFPKSPLGIVAGSLAVAGAAAIGFAASSVKAAADFQQSMLKVQAYAGLTQKQADDMKAHILDMATAVGQSPKALADALYPIISAGYGSADALNILKLSAMTAAASGADTAKVADGLTTALKAMGAPASDAGIYMDIINKTTSQGKMEIPGYAAVIGKLSLAAHGAKVPFVDMNAALATLTTHGFPSVAQASNSLGNLFTQIGVKTDALEQHAKKLKIAFDAHAFSTMSLGQKIAYLSQITGGNQGELLKLVGGSTLALKAFNALTTGSDAYKQNLVALKNASGATNTAFTTASSGFNASMNRVHASIDVLKIKIGSALLPALTGIANAVAPLITKFADWVTKSGVLQGAIDLVKNVLTGFSTTISTIINIGSGLVDFFKNNQVASDALYAVLVTLAGIALAFAITSIPPLVTAFGVWAVGAWGAAAGTMAAAAPIILIGLLIAGLVLGIILLVQHWKQVEQFAIMIWGHITQFFRDDVATPIGNLFNNLGTNIHNILVQVGNFFSNFGSTVHNIVNGIGNAFSGLGSIASNIWNGIVNTVKGAINWIIGGIDNFISGIDSIHVNVPGIGNVGFNIPLIPKLATGGLVGPGSFIAGDEGPELITTTTGAKVYNRDQTAAMFGGGGGGDNRPVYLIVDGQVIATAILPRVGQGIVTATMSGHPIGIPA